MASNIKKKEQIVCEIQDNLESSLSIVIATLNGTKVNVINQLRKEARFLGINVKMFPNSLFKRAFIKTSFRSLSSIFVGQNVIAFSSEKTGDTARIFLKFSKDSDHFKIVGAIFEGNILDVDQINLLSNLPSYEESILQVISVLKVISIGNLINILRYLSLKK